MYLKSKRFRNFLNASKSFFGTSWCAYPVIPRDNRVLFFNRDRHDFGFLSNFYPSILRIDGCDWPHVEAYYQAQKSENPEYRNRVISKNSPSWSKHVGDNRIGDPRISRKSWFKKHPEDLRSDWEAVKVEVMKIALQAKFTQHRNLQLALMNTASAELIEDSPKDLFWGCGEHGLGKNILGNLLMRIRASITEEPQI